MLFAIVVDIEHLIDWGGYIFHLQHIQIPKILGRTCEPFKYGGFETLET
jgi:hypothetical protein